MGSILLVIQVIVALALIAFVLLQRSESDGFGLGSSSGGGVMSGKGKANFMTRTTAILATVFMLNSLLLAIVAKQGSGDSITSRIAEKQAETKELEAPLGDEGAVLDVAPVIDDIKTDEIEVPAAQ